MPTSISSTTPTPTSTSRCSPPYAKQTYGQDIGQNSWLTAEEFEQFIGWLDIDAGSHLLEVASGSGGPALHLADQHGCRVTGVDVNPHGVATARRAAAAAGLTHLVKFKVADATDALPFVDDRFDGLMCIDSMNHFPDRVAALEEWRRVLKPGARAVFTDPVAITGPVTSEELAQRSSIGLFVFVPRARQRGADRAGGLSHPAASSTSPRMPCWSRAAGARRASDSAPTCCASRGRSVLMESRNSSPPCTG